MSGDQEHECDLCGTPYYGFGNNAWPFAGRCCDDCNEMAVIPARLKDLVQAMAEKKKEAA